MKSKETKQKDLAALTESLSNSKSAMVVSFTKLSVSKDQEFRNSLREAGAKYQVVKNTLARIAVKGTPYEDVSDHFKGVTAIAWTENDPVVLTKAISKFMKENADIYTFKTGVVDGNVVDLKQLTTIANLPSKEELIGKLLFVLNSQAQRLVTVINAVPRDLAVVIKQIGEQEGRDGAAAKDAVPAADAAPAETEAEASPADVDNEGSSNAPDAEVVADAAPAAEGTDASSENEPDAAVSDESAEEVAETDGEKAAE